MRKLDRIPDGTTTLFLGGGSYEVHLSAGGQETLVRRYYSLAGQRVMLDGTDTYYLLTDHLGSVVAVADADGDLVSEQRYLPYGEGRFTPGITQTDFGFTGQRNLAAVGLMDYHARWYGAGFRRFVSADTIPSIYSNPQTLNRYSYVLNSPLNFIDPSGHKAVCLDLDCADLGDDIDVYEPGYCDLHPDWYPCGESQSDSPTGGYQEPSEIESISIETWSDPEFEALLWFYKEVVGGFLDLTVDTHDFILDEKLFKGAWKYARWNIPLNWVEAGAMGYSQYYNDRANLELSTYTRYSRASIVFGEALLIDRAASGLASATGGFMSGICGVSGPLALVCGGGTYVIVASTTSYLGERGARWLNELWWQSRGLGEGAYP